MPRPRPRVSSSGITNLQTRNSRASPSVQWHATLAWLLLLGITITFCDKLSIGWAWHQLSFQTAAVRCNGSTPIGLCPHLKLWNRRPGRGMLALCCLSIVCRDPGNAVLFSASLGFNISCRARTFSSRSNRRPLCTHTFTHRAKQASPANSHVCHRAHRDSSSQHH